MIEAYAFFAAFTVQILVLSVLQPTWLARYVRAKADVQLPDWSPTSRERFLGLYRAANAGIAALGLVLLGWLFSHMRNPDWNVVPVVLLLAFYAAVQMAPLVLISSIAAWYKKTAPMRSPPEAKRTASLQRRGLFDIVSPFIVFLAALAYVLFVGFIIYIQRRPIYIQQHPVPGFFGYSLLGDVTLVYALNAFLLYWLVYRRKGWPLETPAYRMRAVEVQVKIIIYSSFAIVAFVSLMAALVLLHLLRWAPFAMSVFLVIAMLFTSMVMFALRRQAEADRLGPAS